MRIHALAALIVLASGPVFGHISGLKGRDHHHHDRLVLDLLAHEPLALEAPDERRPVAEVILLAEHVIDQVLVARADSTNATATVSTLNSTLPLPRSPVPTSAPSPVPTPLDLSISNVMSSSCMTYLTSLVSSSTFMACLPFSLLLTTSSAYATLVSTALSSGNYTHLNELVGYTSSPQPSSDTCESYMEGVMTALTSKSNCASDISSNLAVVKKTKLGVGNYKVMKEAEALVDTDTGSYCYLEAIASEKPDDLYLWGLPGGISLPSSSTPSCSKCSSSLLTTYGSYISSTSTLNSTVINAAVKRLNDACGASFVTFTATNQTSSTERGMGTGQRTGDAGFWLRLLLGAAVAGGLSWI
ncbi:hypothetical protein L198_05048 [Cryptococcus wingfieldii CBS 7118]|uniref:DUF7729 domain-containing protein n=1 Tax=Cryptococcus wingfieldii CBS 7118 TaxID=1295528 RepID=A0A1E3IZZ6_9TREE|nr:hypothetical protein L198_05048 [Cryptococcus wingfieldii CBS 7118]ODN94197.1 hypothetical protein L198_05048 [Cryptococcus wingfieldii CBS 7118]